MRVLWLSMGLLPAVARHLGRSVQNTASWTGNLLGALQGVEPSIKFCCLIIGYESFDPFEEDGVRYVYVGHKGKLYYPRGGVPDDIKKSIKEHIVSFNPDIIHVHGTEYYYGCLESDVYCGKPVVVSLQGVLSQCHIHLTGGLSPRETWWTKYNLRLLKYGHTMFREQTYWRECRAEQEQRVLRQQKYFIGRTEWDRNCVAFYNPHACYFVGNETLRNPFYVERRDPAKIVPHSIYCGAAAGYPLKGAHWLIRAIAALRDDFPDVQLRIAACDRTLASKRSLWNRLRDDAYSAYLRKLIRDLHLQKHIVALPSLSAEEVVRELKNAQLFVLPSLCENSPNSLGEAMLVGTPSIATFVGGVPSIMRDGVDGKLVPPSDPHALAGAIRRWFENPAEAEACVETAREAALRRHDKFCNSRQTLEIYRMILEMSGGDER